MFICVVPGRSKRKREPPMVGAVKEENDEWLAGWTRNLYLEFLIRREAKGARLALGTADMSGMGGMGGTADMSGMASMDGTADMSGMCGTADMSGMDVRALWIQAERRDNGLVTRKVPGEFNYADLGTKGHPAPRFLTLRRMLNIVDCRQIDDETEIEACSVQAPFDEGWQTKVGKGAMRLERKLFIALLACAPTTSDADSRSLATTEGMAEREAVNQVASTGAATTPSWLGWLAVLIATVAFLCQYVRANYEIRRIPPTKHLRTVSAQGPVTYATADRLSPVCAGRYQSLAEREFDAWVMN
jgi:hypothetical protein